MGDMNSSDIAAPQNSWVASALSRVDGTTIYVGAVGASALAFIGFAAYLQLVWGFLPAVSLPGVFFFAGVNVLADRYKVSVSNRTDVSASFLPEFLSGALFGPLAGCTVAAAGMLSAYQKGEHARNVLVASSYVLYAGAAGLTYWLVQWELGSQGLGFAAAGILAGLVYQLVNYMIMAPLMRMRLGWSPAQTWKAGFQPYLPFHFFFLVISLGLLYSFARSGALAFVLLLLPVLGLIYAFRVYSNQRELTHSLERFSLQIAASMITALDLKDNYTAQHSAAVAQYSADIAAALDLTCRERDLAHLAGLLHDLGKISVPDGVLNSEEALGDDEWQVVRDHTTAGRKILSNMSEFEELARIVLHHHERYDGGGYPQGISGDTIPLISRIVAVADSYSAMISHRPYAAPRSPEEAIGVLVEESGSQFDSIIVDTFVELLELGDSRYRRAEHMDFHLQVQKARFLQEMM